MFKTRKSDGRVFNDNKKRSDSHHGSVKPTSGIKKPAFIPAEKPTKFQQEELDSINDFYKLTKPETIMMKPQQFLKATDSDPNWVPDHGLESVKELKKRMEEGKPIDKPFLVVDPKFSVEQQKEKILNLAGMELQRVENPTKPIAAIVEHEGRHRMYTARKLKIKEVPVDVYCVKHGILNCPSCQKLAAEDIANALSQFPNEKKTDAEVKKRIAQWFRNVKYSQKEHKKMEAVFE